MFKNYSEKDAEQCQCQKSTLLHAIDNREGSEEVGAPPYLDALVFVQLDNTHARAYIYIYI